VSIDLMGYELWRGDEGKVVQGLAGMRWFFSNTQGFCSFHGGDLQDGRLMICVCGSVM